MQDPRKKKAEQSSQDSKEGPRESKAEEEVSEGFKDRSADDREGIHSSDEPEGRSGERNTSNSGKGGDENENVEAQGIR